MVHPLICHSCSLYTPHDQTANRSCQIGQLDRELFRIRRGVASQPTDDEWAMDDAHRVLQGERKRAEAPREHGKKAFRPDPQCRQIAQSTQLPRTTQTSYSSSCSKLPRTRARGRGTRTRFWFGAPQRTRETIRQKQVVEDEREAHPLAFAKMRISCQDAAADARGKGK